METAPQFLNRRHFLGKAGVLSLAGMVVPGRWMPGARGETPAAPDAATADIIGRLQVRPVINAMGTVTILGGSIMAPEVIGAMQEASRHFVVMEELLESAGRRIAQLLGVAAATVTTGAAGAITAGTAACVTGSDPRKMERLPDTEGMRNEIIIQKSHRNEYEPQMRLVGAKIIEIETRAELEAAIGSRTAMLFFMNKADPDGKIRREEWIALGRKHGIPTYNDAAADIPPKGHLSDYVRMGFDLVGFSGGKGLLGPQCSGLLLGRADLVAAARRNASPYGGTIGRGMKVGKEEIAGLVAAVERYLTVDHGAEYRELESRVRRISAALAGQAGVRTEIFVPEVANHLPHLAVEWDPGRIPLRAEEARRRLLDGQPRIAVLERGPNSVGVSVWMMRPDEPAVVGQRLRELLASPA